VPLSAAFALVALPRSPGFARRDIARRAVRTFIGYRRTSRGMERVARAPAAWRYRVEQSRGSPDGGRIRADQATMTAIAAGDGAAFARLVGALSPQLLRFARTMLAASSADAEEVVQEALIRLWQQAASWRPEARISTWLHQVVYRLSIDALRRRRLSVDIDGIGVDFVDDAPLPEQRLALREDARAVQAAVAALPVRQRTAIVLCHYQGLSQADAAGVMGIGEDAYESLLARGRRSLRAALAGGKEGP
jgi:RNA polymerase sigma-70 factor (ECF subfamily)